MRVLLDTHIALWALMSPHQLPRMARRILSEEQAAVSVVSLWEVAIKRRLGRPGAPPISAREFAFEVDQAGFSLIGLILPHIVYAESLASVHTDPFDHILVAQAMAEEMVLITADRSLSAYGPSVRIV